MKNVMWLAVAILGVGSFGCVAQSKYDQLNEAYLKSREQVVDMEGRVEQLTKQIQAMQEADRLKAQNPDLQKALEQAIADREAARKALAELEQRIRGLDLATTLPGPVNDALIKFAEENPGLVTYDPKRGMLRFASDMTFALGSTDVNPNAVTALSRLAEILKSPAAASLEAIIVGHTDNVPIARVRAQHPTNWHLSVHRAISVKDVMQKAGIPPVRMEVAGYGEYRPITPNGPRGAQSNRRVEIYLRPSTWSGIEPGAAADFAPEAVPARPATPTVAPRRTTDPPEMFK